MNKYTAEFVEAEVEVAMSQGKHGTAAMFREFAALLRERESARAAVTDEMVSIAVHAYDSASPSFHPSNKAMRAALEAVAPMLASARIPDGWRVIMQEKPAGATHYMVQPRWELGQLKVDIRWFQLWKNGIYAEWCTDCDNEYPDFRPLGIPNLSPILQAVEPMLPSSWVPDEKEDLDPVRLRREGRVATEWERGFNEGWNDCRETMLAIAPKPEEK